MKIIADKDIYQVEEIFSPAGELELIPGREITPQHVKNADALIIRTVSKINRDLVDSSSLRFVGSASSGFDHVDLSELKKSDIFFSHAPGCNANAVVDYVFAVLALNALKNNDPWLGKSVGIIGAGNVGSSLAKKMIALGMRVSIFDPYLDNNHELAKYFSSLDFAMQQDVVSFHTSLSSNGVYPSYHMVNKQLLSGLKNDAILINAARGELIDSHVLLEFLLSRPDVKAALDVWENEPDINSFLKEKAFVATPHIAGYSLNGKLNGTRKVFEDFCRFFDLANANEGLHDNKTLLKTDFEITSEEFLNKLILKAYPLSVDCISVGTMSKKEAAVEFDSLRNNYSYRPEFKDFQIRADVKGFNLQKYSEIIQTLGFTLL